MTPLTVLLLSLLLFVFHLIVLLFFLQLLILPLFRRASFGLLHLASS